jgi:hypothetical protein
MLLLLLTRIGISVNRIVITLSGKKDFTPGLTYVAMSRVRSLKGLLIEEPFSLERLRYKPSATVIMRNRDLERRKLQEIPILVRDDDDLSLYGSDISLPIPLYFEEAGQATSFDIPVLHSEPVHSSVSVPTSEQPHKLPSDFGFTSHGNNSGGGNANGSGNGNGNG